MTSAVFECAHFRIDAANRSFSRDGVDVSLEPKVFSVILELLARPASLVTRDQLLDSVWGHRYVTPSTLSRVIALARRAFDDDSDQPRFIQTVHGVGYRFIGPLESRTAPAAEGRARFAPPPSLRLPARLDALIGREVELEQLAEAFAATRAITVLGTGGMGKTQCALEFGRRHAADFPDGVWFFDLAPLQDAGDWLQSLAIALAVPPGPRRAMLDAIGTLLADRCALFVVDNCDRISSEAGIVVLELLRTAPHLKVLATSQQQLNYVGETVVRIPPLALPQEVVTGTRAGLVEVESAPAVALLLKRVRAVQPNFVITATNAPQIVEICRQLDGMPLALELAAARFSLLSAEQVLDRLNDRFRFLVSDSAGRERRHRNLLVLLDWSFQLLSQQEHRLLMWLSVCTQGWTVDAAIDLGHAYGVSAETLVDLLSGLVNRSLVTADMSTSPPRYRLLESVREFALVRLHEAGEVERARDAHLQSVRQMCERAHREMLSGRMRVWTAQLALEHGNIDAAIEHAVTDNRNLASAQAIVGSLLLYFKARGPYVAALRWAQRVQRTSEGSDTLERGRALLCMVIISYYLVLSEETTEQAYNEAIHILKYRGDAWGEACARSYYALWLINMNRAAEAMPQFDDLCRIAQRFEDAWVKSRTELTRSWLYFDAGDIVQAVRVLSAVRRLGNDFDQHTFIDIYLALGSFQLGHLAATARYCHDALQASLEFRNARGTAGCLEQFAYIAKELAMPLEAVRLLGVASRTRELTASPLLRFWIAIHDRTVGALREELGTEVYAAAFRSGQEQRLEDAANEVMTHLHHYLGKIGDAASSGANG